MATTQDSHLIAAQSATMYQLLIWIDLLEQEGHGTTEYLDDSVVITMSRSVADEFTLELGGNLPALSVPSQLAEIWLFAPWTQVVYDSKKSTLSLYAGADNALSNQAQITMPVASELAPGLEDALFINLVATIDDDQSYRRNVQLLVKN